MKKVILFLALVVLRADAMLSQMEMGQPQLQERSTIEACCECGSSPKFCIIALTTNKMSEYLLNKAWDSMQQPNQTALQPMVYSAALMINFALIAGAGWQCFKQSKFKEKNN